MAQQNLLGEGGGGLQFGHSFKIFSSMRKKLFISKNINWIQSALLVHELLGNRIINTADQQGQEFCFTHDDVCRK